MSANVIFIIAMVVGTLLGFMLGFGRSLKLLTKGLVGVIISICVCVMFGGMLRNIGQINDFINDIDEYVAGLWSVLKYLHIGTIAYYILLFIATRIAWILLVRIVCGITEIDNPVMKIVNKISGALFVAAFIFGLTLLGLAIIKLFESSEFAIDFLKKIEGGILETLYKNNPIKIK